MLPVITLGCRLNFAESARMAELAQAAGLRHGVIINSCAVTSEAERQTRQAIRRAARDHPQQPVILTGCAAEIAPKSYAAMPETGLIIRNRDKLSPAVWRRLARLQPANMAAMTPAAPAKKIRAFLPIQQGCDHACTFCVIPQGRGAAVSLPREEILAQGNHLLAQGARELTLTGVDIASYGREQDGDCHLGTLVEFLLKSLPALARLRLSSLDPAIDDAKLESLFANPLWREKLMPHLHLSLQSGSAMLLKRMRRRHSPEQALALITRLRHARPAFLFGADLIAGFPTESAAHFAETLAFLEAARLSFFHIFPYQPRPNTPAARMPQLPAPVIRARAASLRQFGAAQQQKQLAQLCGQSQPILMETPFQGRIPAFAPVKLAEAQTPGAVLLATMQQNDAGLLIARAA